MLYIPAGTYTLTERLWIKKSNIVIRGAGAGQTVLDIPKSEPGGAGAGAPASQGPAHDAPELRSALQQVQASTALDVCMLHSHPSLPGPPAPPAGLWDLYGKSKGSESGGYVNWGAPLCTALPAGGLVSLAEPPAHACPCLLLPCWAFWQPPPLAVVCLAAPTRQHLHPSAACRRLHHRVGQRQEGQPADHGKGPTSGAPVVLPTGSKPNITK